MQRKGPAGGDQWGQSLVGIPPAIPKAKPARNPGNVRVHREFFVAKRKKQHDVSRLLPHPWQGQKPSLRLRQGKLFQKRQGKLAPLLLDLAERRLDAVGPLAVHPRRPNGLRELLQRRCEDLRPPGKTRAHGRICPVAIAIGGVLGENGLNEELQGVKVRLLRVPECFLQALIASSEEFRLHRP